MRNDELIILDFDHTVFNTTLFIEAIKKRFKEEFNVEEEDFMKQRNAVKECCMVIDIDTFIAKLSHENKGAMHDAIHDEIKKNASRFVFSDVVPFIKKHIDGYDIMVATHGDQELQTEKIRHSDLPAGVTHVISLESKDRVLAPLVDQYKKIHFIDDKAGNIDIVKSAFPNVVTYFIQRPEDHPYANQPSKCDCADLTVGGLNELEL